MTEMGLSLFSQYHIRQLLHLYRDRLRLVAAPGRALAASEDADLNAVVEGLYLEEVAIEAVFRELNTFARLHSELSDRARRASSNSLGSNHLGKAKRELEVKILQRLGLELLPQPALA